MHPSPSPPSSSPYFNAPQASTHLQLLAQLRPLLVKPAQLPGHGRVLGQEDGVHPAAAAAAHIAAAAAKARLVRGPDRHRCRCRSLLLHLAYGRVDL